jgi:DNA replication and repair protein RecF
LLNLKRDYNELKSSAGVTELFLHNYRNYSSLNLQLEARPVVLMGPNGAGKTNLLEALSFLSPGRGLRSAKLAQVTNVCTDKEIKDHK